MGEWMESVFGGVGAVRILEILGQGGHPVHARDWLGNAVPGYGLPEEELGQGQQNDSQHLQSPHAVRGPALLGADFSGGDEIRRQEAEEVSGVECTAETSAIGAHFDSQNQGLPCLCTAPTM